MVTVLPQTLAGIQALLLFFKNKHLITRYLQVKSFGIRRLFPYKYFYLTFKLKLIVLKDFKDLYKGLNLRNYFLIKFNSIILGK